MEHDELDQAMLDGLKELKKHLDTLDPETASKTVGKAMMGVFKNLTLLMAEAGISEKIIIEATGVLGAAMVLGVEDTLRAMIAEQN